MIDFIKANIGNLYFPDSDTFYDKNSIIELIEKDIEKFSKEGLLQKKIYLKASANIQFATSLLALLCNGCQVVITDKEQSLDNEIEENKHNEALLCLSSSGTTGPQKLILWSFKRLLKKIQNSHSSFTDAELERSACALNLSFGHGLYGCFLLPLFRGQTAYLIENNLSSFLNLPKILKKHKITFLSLTPHIYEMMSNANVIEKVDSLLRIQSASSPITPKSFSAMVQLNPDAKRYNAYGLTEMMSWVSFFPLNDENDINYIALPDKSICFISKENELFILEGEGALINENLKQLKLNDCIYFSTNDTIAIDENNRARILGRTDDQINLNGIKFYPQEIEEFILSKLDNKITLIVSNKNNDLYLIVENKEDDETIEKLKNILREIPSQKRPKYILFVDKVPRNSRSKISRNEVREKCIN